MLMDWKRSLERFHDTNRYFIPLVFIGLVLMFTGALYNNTIVITGDVDVNKLVMLSGDTVVKAITLRPGWNFRTEVVTNKPVNLSITNLEGNMVASSTGKKISFTPEFLDLYFVHVIGPESYALLDLTYTKSGQAPYPAPYLFFASGLILILGVIVYYLLEPWGLKFKRLLTMTDAIFYPLMFLMASIIFWVFRDTLIWFVPKNMSTVWLLIIIPTTLLVGCVWVVKQLNDNKRVFFLRNNRRNKGFFMSLFGFFIADLVIFLAIVFDYSGLVLGGDFWVPLVLMFLLILLYMKTGLKNALVIYTITWLTSMLLKLLAYSIGVPVIFDTFLSVPSQAGVIQLFITISSMVVLTVYFLIKGYYAKNTAKAINYGLYASVCIQSIMQVFTGTSLL